MKGKRKYPVGAEVRPAEGTTDFCVWAPDAETLSVSLWRNKNECLSETPLEKDSQGYFQGAISGADSGMLYGFRLGDRNDLLPDPASRFQPHGLYGLSLIVDPSEFAWQDDSWKGGREENNVLYEIHPGTFTTGGNWEDARERLSHLKELGVTFLELMPIAEYLGSFGWGYDGVFLYAPSRNYGSVLELKRFINEAHLKGMGVILDVVFNHLGNGSWILKQFSRNYFSYKYKNEWGDAINFDGEKSEQVCDYFLSNIAYWIEEYHFDGFRIDATQQIYDSSPVNILKRIIQKALNTEPEKKKLIVAENEAQDSKLWRYGYQAAWSDDFHHAALVALTGRREAYYTDYKGSSQEFVSCAKRGYLYQGQYYSWQKGGRGTPSFEIPPRYFIHYLENHDQVANSLKGERLHKFVNPSELRAMTALLLLMPETPLLFQGQEIASDAPFYFFLDQPDQKDALIGGRTQFLSQFPSIKRLKGPLVPEPTQRKTFDQCRIRWEGGVKQQEVLALHKSLILLRHSEQIFSVSKRKGMDGAVISEDAFVLRYFGVEEENDRLLLVNLGSDYSLHPLSEPLFSNPTGMEWRVEWYSEDPLFGGSGADELFDKQGGMRIVAKCAYYLRPVRI